MGDFLQALDDASPYILAILVALTALSHALQAAARAFDHYARSTKAEWDDEAARNAVRFADAMAGALDAVTHWLPRIGVRGKDKQ